MKNVKAVVNLAEVLLEEHSAYSTKPTKAASKRMRMAMNDIKKLTTPAKAELLEADKG